MENRALTTITIPVDCVLDLCRILNVEEEKLLRRLETGIGSEDNNIARLNSCRILLDYILATVNKECDIKKDDKSIEEQKKEKPLGFGNGGV